MFRSSRLVTLVSCLGLLVIAPAASATSTVSIGTSGQLVNKLAVAVPVTYSCPASTAQPFFGPALYVSLQEAVSKSIANGSAWMTPSCDGTTHNDVATIYPTVSSYTSTGVPFKEGVGTASASLNDCTPDPTNPWNVICDNASAGPLTVKINSGK